MEGLDGYTKAAGNGDSHLKNGGVCVKKIFILDDEPDILEIIKKYLIREGYLVEPFSSAESLLESTDFASADMFILDIMLPGEMDGLELCRQIRKKSNVPIIFVSAKGEELDRIIGLELGGDDYLVKPFSPRELVARVKTVFRRMDARGREQELIEHNGLRIMPVAREVLLNNQKIELTGKEYELLVLLLQNLNSAFSRQRLLDLVWGYDYVGDIRAVDDLVKRVRRKLREAGSPVSIATVWGYGYKIEE